MSDEAKKYHEEDEIGKTYDFRVAGRLFRYLKPYWRLAAAALSLTLLTNILISTQPYFTKMALCLSLFRCVFATLHFLLCSGDPAK